MQINGKTAQWQCVIGLEVHAQIASKSKLFSRAATVFGAAPNSQVSLIDAAMPGMLPVLNEYCLHQAIKTGLGLKAQINLYSVFDRKNYFYPDLPQGYQISQFYHPIVTGGHIVIALQDHTPKIIHINRLHLEQDAGKSMHDQSEHYSFIDLNRCGIALMEIVSEPDISSSYEAAEYLKKLRSILRYVGSCDGDMEKGSMRCDANVSVRRPGGPLGTRCEIKNLNSIRHVVKAIEFEAGRQVELIELGGQVRQETRLFDASTGQTKLMRLKEAAYDYRYFPDPDLLPVKISQVLVDQLTLSLPELPDAKISRYTQNLYLSQYDAEVIVADEAAAHFFEESIKYGHPKIIANWLTSELFGYLNKYSVDLSQCKITPSMLGNLTKLIADKVISGKIAKIVFEVMFNTGQPPEEIIQQRSLVQVSDNAALQLIITEVINENQASVAAYRNGKERLFGFFVGQVMKKSQGRASPEIVNELLKQQLS